MSVPLPWWLWPAPNCRAPSMRTGTLVRPVASILMIAGFGMGGRADLCTSVGLAAEVAAGSSATTAVALAAARGRGIPTAGHEMTRGL